MGFVEAVKRKKAETRLLTPQKRQKGETEMEEGKQQWDTEKRRRSK